MGERGVAVLTMARMLGSIFVVGCFASLLAGPGPARAAPPRFGKAVHAQVQRARMFDIGVADPDNDGWQDIFTTNHKFQSSFLHNDRGRSFADQGEDIGLGPDEQFPGLGLMRAPRRMSAPGVYVYPTDRTGERGQVHIVSVGTPTEGRMRLLSREVRLRGPAARRSFVRRGNRRRPIVDFKLGARDDLTVSGQISDLAIAFRFKKASASDSPGSDGITADQIRIGARAVSPGSTRFQFKLRDRHAVAFADIGGDRDQDVFVATGGLGGGVAKPRYRGLVADQLLIGGASASGHYGNRIERSGVRKGICRDRGTGWVDYDRSGLLDLFVTCEGTRSRLYEQTSPGRFTHVTTPHVKADTYAFAQLGRGRPALLVSTPRGLEVWRSSGSRWHRSQTVRAGADAVQIALADQDNSGSLDVLVTAEKSTALLLNRHGRLHRASSSKLMLPSGGEAASFVDYDNDGFQDISFAPQGLYRWNQRSGRYRETGALTTRSRGYATVQWMDYDNDGRRDPIIATAIREFSPRSRIRRKHNRTHDGNWLEIDLEGRTGNREAIGARVVVKTRPNRGARRHSRTHSVRRFKRRITQWVGQNDDSRFSQGQYRLFFGLGKARIANRVKVQWPDGKLSRFKHFRVNRLVRIREGR